MTTDNKTLADVKPGGRVRLGDQAERARFEAWMLSTGRTVNDLRKLADGYVYEDVRGMWAAWQAALSAQPSPGGQEPVAEHHIMPLAREVLAAQCRARLEFASERDIKTGRHDDNWPELQIIAHALRHPHYMERPEGGSPAQAVDLEEFRPFLVEARDRWNDYGHTMRMAGRNTSEAERKVREASRLIALIDGKAVGK